MIQIYIDYSNNKILGYNTCVQENYGLLDAVLVDDSNLETLESLDLFGRLYYIDGKVKVADTVDAYYGKLESLDRSLAEARAAVLGEHKTFMDNILSGMQVDDAAAISKEERELVKSLESQKKEMVAEHEESIQNAVEEIFLKEEQDMAPEYFLSMVTVVRDENDYLEEWIRYHIEQMGFGHFYIYDNESSVPVKDYLESVNFKYLDRLTVIPWETSRATQEDSHNHFLKNYAQETKWFLAADPDEYVSIKDDFTTLREFLEENSQYATIKCLWRHFNANGQVVKMAGTDMERFTQETDWEEWKHGGKKFAQSNRVAGFRSYVPIERMGARALGYGDGAAKDFFQLNHYFTRSWEEWQQKIRRGSSNPGYRRKLSMFFELNPDLSYLDTGEDYEQGYGASIQKDSQKSTEDENSNNA